MWFWSKPSTAKVIFKDACEEALKQTAGSTMNDILQKQYSHVKTGRDRIRDLRDFDANRK